MTSQMVPSGQTIFSLPRVQFVDVGFFVVFFGLFLIM